jgi:DNA repair exonuclease SbcCD ATPase subunit
MSTETKPMKEPVYEFEVDFGEGDHTVGFVTYDSYKDAQQRISTLEAQLEKLSGKTGYCEQCEKAGRENKELEAQLSGVSEYLKEGETVVQRIEREKKDTQIALKLLAESRQREEGLKEMREDARDVFYGGEFDDADAMLNAIQRIIFPDDKALSGGSHK